MEPSVQEPQGGIPPRPGRAGELSLAPAVPLDGTQAAPRQRLQTFLATVAPALGSRNFRLFWLGQTVSVVGTSVQVVAEGWLIYQLTQSTLWLGLVGLLALIPVVPISFLGGLLIDRVPRRKLILAGQVGLLAQAATFGLLATFGQIQLWHIIALYFVFGGILAIDHPARRAFLVELVEEKDWANAVALNATVFNLSSLVGYALAGFLIATLGAGGTMLFNAATYLAPIAALLMIRVADRPADRPAPAGAGNRGSLLTALLEGFRTLWQQPAVLAAMSLMAVVGGLAYPVFGLMPAFAEEVVQTDAVGLGLLLAAGALGSVVGTAAVARLGVHHRGRTLVWAGLLLPLLVAMFAWTRTLVLACLVLVLLGTALLILQSLAITLVQVNIPDRVRGRVMSLYSQLHAGSDTLGNVAIGGLAVYLGLPLALGLGAMLALIYAVGLRLALPALARLD
ncbi:MAG: MFS transporter [Litorilinea sp.]|nr:MAG: MFS transporter [Litorilinea sp.]